MARTRIEPMTSGVTSRCSTTELGRVVVMMMCCCNVGVNSGIYIPMVALLTSVPDTACRSRIQRECTEVDVDMIVL